MFATVIGRLVIGLGSVLGLVLVGAAVAGIVAVSGLGPAAVRAVWVVGLVLAPFVLVAVELLLAGLLGHVGSGRHAAVSG
ncbi:MAG: hypothetical protein ABEH78_06795 [Haloferacaceae archaeon]